MKYSANIPSRMTWHRDFRFAFRSLRNNPGFVLVALLTLSLGIGANTAMFSIVKAELLAPLPYPDSDRIVTFRRKGPAPNSLVSGPNFEFWKRDLTGVQELAAHEYAEFNLMGGGSPLRATAFRVTPGFFDAMGTQPLLGRSLGRQLPEDTRIAVLGYPLYRDQFGLDVGILGKTIRLDEQPYRIVGVMPPGFEFPTRAQLWIPWDVSKEFWVHMPKIDLVSVVARLAEGRGIDDVQTELDALSKRLLQSDARLEGHAYARIITLHEDAEGRLRTPLAVLMCGVVFLLLVGCVNLTNLMHARGLKRRQSMAIRMALGAGRSRVVALVVFESLLVSIVGALLALVIAYGGMRLLLAIVPAHVLPRLGEARVDWMVVAFALLTAVVSALLFGLQPAFSSTRHSLMSAIRNRGTIRDKGGTGPQHTLVIAQIALTTILVLGSAFLIRSYMKLVGVNLGFETDNCLTAQTVLSGNAYASEDQKISYQTTAMEALEGLPGVRQVGTTNNLAFGTWSSTVRGVQVEGRPVADDRERTSSDFAVVGGDFFRAMGIPVIEGRVFASHDGPTVMPTVVIDERAASRFFPEDNPLGQRLLLLNKWRTIIGVVGSVRRRGPMRPAEPMTYLPFAQHPQELVIFVVKTRQDPSALSHSVTDALQRIDRRQPISAIRTMDDYFSNSVSRNRFNGMLMSLFGVCALITAGLGLFGLIQFRANQQVRAIAIRMALGARRNEVLMMLLRQGLGIIVIGLASGIAAFLALSGFLSGMLFGTSPLDPTSYVLVSVLLILVGFVAGTPPAIRSMRVNPSQLLKSE